MANEGSRFVTEAYHSDRIDYENKVEARLALAEVSTELEVQFLKVQKAVRHMPEKVLELVDITNQLLKLQADLKEISRPDWSKRLRDKAEGRG